MRDTKKRYKPSKGNFPPFTPEVFPDPTLKPLDFEHLIKNRGLRWKLQKAAYCPNVTNAETMQHDSNCNVCENGMIYFGNVEIHGIMQAQKLERLYEINGSWDIGEAIVTFSAYTDGENGEPGKGKPIDLQMFDRLTCCDYEFRWPELIEHSPTGIDRLRYPALSVEYLAGKTGKQYFVDQDFFINHDGHIQWKTNKQPTYDMLNKRGEVFTIVYTARPVFLVVQLMHELRATKALHIQTGQFAAVRLPQQVLVRRDYLFQHKADKKGMPTTRAPRDGGNITPF